MIVTATMETTMTTMIDGAAAAAAITFGVKTPLRAHTLRVPKAVALKLDHAEKHASPYCSSRPWNASVTPT